MIRAIDVCAGAGGWAVVAAAGAASLRRAGVALLAGGAWGGYLTSQAVLRKGMEMVRLAAAAVVAANRIGRLVGVTIS